MRLTILSQMPFLPDSFTEVPEPTSLRHLNKGTGRPLNTIHKARKEIIMEIIKATTTDRKTLYQLTRGADVRKISDMVGQDLTVKNFVLYKDQKSNGEFMQVLAIEAEDGTMVATNSSTFINEFTGIAEICGPEASDMVGEKVRIMAGTGKSGRRFMTCVWA